MLIDPSDVTRWPVLIHYNIAETLSYAIPDLIGLGTRMSWQRRLRTDVVGDMKHAVKAFFSLSVVMLLAAATFKLLSLSGHARILDQPDPILGLTNRWMYLVIGVVELLVVMYILFGRSRMAKSALLLWLGSNFAVYRLAHWWLAVPEPCACLGRATDWLPSIKAFVHPTLQGIVGFLIVGGAVSLWWHWRTEAVGARPLTQPNASSASNLGAQNATWIVRWELSLQHPVDITTGIS